MLPKLVRRAGVRRHRALLLLVALAAFVGPSTSAGADATVRLSNDVVHHLDAATLLGPVPATQQLSVGVFLRNPIDGQARLTPDGQTLRTILTVRNLTTDIPAPGTENTYNFVWFLNGIEYFTQLAVEPGGVVNAYNGRVLHVSLETRFQQLHVDPGVITPGPNGTVEVDVPLANIGSPALGQVLEQPSATACVRLGVMAGSLQTIDSGGPNPNYVLAGC